MRLNREQKRAIKSRYAKESAAMLAVSLGLPESVIAEYIRTKYGVDQKINNLAFPINKFTPTNVAGFVKSNYGYALSLLTIVVIIYLRALGAQFVSDDLAVIKNDPGISSWSYVIGLNIMVIPRSILYFIISNLFGIEPFVYHLVNLLFHLGVVFLVYVIFGLLTFQSVGLITAILVGIHPLLSEPVVWVSGGPYTQFSFFLLISLLFFSMYSASAKPKYYVISLALALLSLWTSDKAMPLPALFTIFTYAFGDIKKVWKKLIPYYGMASIWIIYYLSQIKSRVANVMHEGFVSDISHNPFEQLPVAVSRYLELLVWPDALSFYHSDFYHSTLTHLLRAGVLILLVSTLIWGIMKNRKVAFGIAFFLTALSPTLTPLGVSSIVAERYVYLGSIGLFFLLALGFRHYSTQKKYELVTYFILIVILIGFSVRTFVRLGDWYNEDTLWVATGRTATQNPVTHMNLGDMHRRHKNYKEAEREFFIALQLSPNNAYAFYNLGLTYTEAGAHLPAIEAYNRSLAIDPGLWQADQNLSVVYSHMGKDDKALEYINTAIKKAPYQPALYINAGVMYEKAGKRGEAINSFKKALELDPNNNRVKSLLIELKS